ncbi:MAG: hypothetical protein HYZ45_01115, partial [Burkholderiales bacterium]|nr:hypothetical protein [Burkholderiales bacterium]
MNQADEHKNMIALVATKLGPELLQEMAFVGGCTTALLLTDEVTKAGVRHTEDVDLIVHVLSVREWYQLREELQQKGFKEVGLDAGSMPQCAMKLGKLRVDFMPDDPAILGFSNPWYTDALRTADPFVLSANLTIRLIKPEYFLATKLVAYIGRGQDDPMSSQDIEDVLNLFDGREEVIAEMAAAPKE